MLYTNKTIKKDEKFINIYFSLTFINFINNKKIFAKTYIFKRLAIVLNC